jgi:hypothetical protein
MKNTNAFESTFSQVNESNAKTGDSSKGQAPEIAVKDNLKPTKQHVAKLTSQHSNKSTIKMNHEDLNVAELERKTFYLKPELLEIFKYAKFKKKLGESQMANIAFETYFEMQFGKNWRTLLK